MRGRQNSGFTLVELLLAMVVTTAVISLASYSYSMLADKWRSDLGQFDEVTHKARTVWQTQQVLKSAVPYIVWDPSQNQYVYYFLGREDGLTFVTQAPIFNPKGTAVVRLFSEQEHDGDFRLVYEEAPLYEELLSELNQNLDFRFRVVLLTDLPSVSISYYGYENEQQANDQTTTRDMQQWFSQYDGAETFWQPNVVKISMGSESMAQELASGHPKLMELFTDD